MSSALPFVIPAVLVVGLLVLSRTVRDRRHAGSATTSLTIVDNRIERRLADGRTENADLTSLRWIEVVCTRVPTADGASTFALLAEGAETGCLVPLGVGLDDEVMVRLAQLPGFDLRAFSDACAAAAPARTVVWGEPDPELS